MGGIKCEHQSDSISADSCGFSFLGRSEQVQPLVFNRTAIRSAFFLVVQMVQLFKHLLLYGKKCVWVCDKEVES